MEAQPQNKKKEKAKKKSLHPALHPPSFPSVVIAKGFPITKTPSPHIHRSNIGLAWLHSYPIPHSPQGPKSPRPPRRVDRQAINRRLQFRGIHPAAMHCIHCRQDCVIDGVLSRCNVHVNTERAVAEMDALSSLWRCLLLCKQPSKYHYREYSRETVPIVPSDGWMR
jgi:hypothetical protein